jgi:hypothetical protein
MPRDDPAVAESIVVHGRAVCEYEDHLWDVIRNLSIPTDQLTDTREQAKVDFWTDAMVKAHLYMRIRGYSQNEFADLLSERPTLVKSCGFDIQELSSAPSQQNLSYAWGKFSKGTRDIIKAAAKGLQREVVEHGIMPEALVPTPPEESEEEDGEKSTREYMREKTQKAVELARRHAFTEFFTGRAENLTYEDIWILDQYARICSKGGSSHAEGEIGFLLNDDLTCHGSTFLRAIKMLATPDDDSMELDLKSSFDEARMPKIEAIRDKTMEQFDGATDNIVNSIRGDDPFDDRKTIAAIDITGQEFTVGPWADEDVPKADYPRMVNGYIDDDPDKQGYKFATITIVGDNAPIILGVEPYKQNSDWEEEDAPSYSKGELVARLLDRAQEFVDIDEVLLDRGFYANEVIGEIDKRDLLYTIPVPDHPAQINDIEGIKLKEGVDMGILPNVEFWYEGELQHYSHRVYVPSRNSDSGNYAVFVTNRDRPESVGDIKHIVNQYRRRWDIENQYKSVKEYLPSTSSTDYRIRLTNFVVATIIYNLWRLTDYLIKVALGIRIRDPPELTAKTFAEVLGQFLLRLG